MTIHTPEHHPASSDCSNLLMDDTVFAAGVRSLADLVAPTRIEKGADYMLVEREGRVRYSSYITISGLPRRLRAGWAKRILDLKLPMQFVQHFAPFEPGLIIRQLESHLTQIESNRFGKRYTQHIEKAADDIGAEDERSLLRGVEEGTKRIFSLSLTIGVQASTLQRLEERKNFLLSHLRQYQLQIGTANLLQDAAWQTCQPQALDQLGRRINVDNGSLATCFPFVSSVVGTGDGAFLGLSSTNEPVYVDPWSKKNDNPHIVVVGKTGGGKSYLAKRLLVGMIATGNVDGVVMDLAEDYDQLHAELTQEHQEGESVESQLINLARTCAMNPLDLPFTPDDVLEDPTADLLADQIDNHLLPLAGMLVTDDTLSRDEDAIMRQAYFQTYASRGITREAIKIDPETLRIPAPSLSDLIRTLKHMETGKQEIKESLAARLEKFEHYFAAETSIALNCVLTIFSIKDVDETHYAIVVWAVQNFIRRNRAQLRYKRMLMFYIEEASFLLAHPVARKYLEQCARSLRKQGIAQVTISQQPDDFLETGKVLLANAGTCFFLGMPITSSKKLGLSPQLENVLAHAKRGECIMRIGNEYAHIKVLASPQEHQIYTTDPVERQQQQKMHHRNA